MATELVDDPVQEAEEDFIFNEYAIDDTLDPLNRLIQYYQSDFSLQRLVLVRELCDTAEFAGYQESAKVIIPLLAQFTSDSEPGVRNTLVQQLFPLAQYFVKHGGEAGYNCLLNTFLTTGFELLVDKNVGVGMAALKTIRSMATLVRPMHVQEHLLNTVITLAHDERAEDYRVVAAQLFNDLAPIFGPEFCINAVLPELELLSNDNSFLVRKTVGCNLGGIGAVVNTDAAQQKVVTLFLALCQDDTWGVRQACAESIEQVSLSMPEWVRVEHLVPAFTRLLEDNSRWVRTRAYESFGPLLHTLAEPDISKDLVRLYTDMAYMSENGDSELSEYCAYSLPAVVQAIGKDRWDEIVDAFGTMLKDVNWKVRKSLAYSLHELSEMLGTMLTDSSLVTAFEMLLRDLDDIKLGVVLNVDRFLAMVPVEKRARLVTLLCHVPLESENWRLRNEVAKRIGLVGVLLTPTSPALSSVTALVQRLLDDSVMEVRASTYQPAAVLLKHLRSTPEGAVTDNANVYLSAILVLATRPSFQGRQMFAYVTQQAAEVGADEDVSEFLLHSLKTLAADRVSNVRMVVRRVMEATFTHCEPWSSHPQIAEIMNILAAHAAEEEGTEVAKVAGATAGGAAAIPTGQTEPAAAV